MKLTPILIFAVNLIASSLLTRAHNVKVEEGDIPFPFEPPSAEFCKHNELGSDMYVSLFRPCQFIFYTGSSNIPEHDHFSCSGILDNANNTIISTQEREVMDWPDSCVANGPRCYSLTEYPNLQDFTLFGGDSNMDKYYSMSFPEDATYVSVDCSEDYHVAKQAMKRLPEVLEPVITLIFFGFIVLIGLLIAAVICCVCICSGGGQGRRGYTNIDGFYDGPPVEARKIIV